MQPDHTTFCDFILCGCGLRNKMPVLSHSPCGFAQPQTANAATPQPPRRLLRAGGSLRSSSRKAVRRHNSAALCRAAPLRPLQQPQGGLRDGLTKRAFCRRSPPFFAAVAAVGRSLRSLRAAAGGTFKPPTAAELCRPPLAAVWLAVPPRAAASEVTVQV